MTQFFSIHTDSPESRAFRKATRVIKHGGLVVYPTDSGYALGCQLGARDALRRIRKIRQLDDGHNMTLVCRDLSDLSTYAKVTNSVFRLLKAFTPGSYTFLLHATKEIPKKMLHPERKTVGLRVPDHAIAWTLLEALGGPLMSTTLLLPNAQAPLSEPSAIRDLLGQQVDLIIDGGDCAHEPTTIVDFTSGEPKIVREGKGDPAPFK